MPKSDQKRPSEPSKENVSILANDQDYDCNLQVEYEDEFPPLPATPSKPPIAKKPMLVHTDSALKSDDAVRSLSNLINSRSDAIEKMVETVCNEIKHMNEKIVCIEKKSGEK